MRKRIKHDVPLEQRLLASVDDVSKMIGRGRSTVYRMCRSGRFKTTMVGSQMMVVVSSIINEEQQSAAA
jgi:hypothetical protein